MSVPHDENANASNRERFSVETCQAFGNAYEPTRLQSNSAPATTPYQTIPRNAPLVAPPVPPRQVNYTSLNRPTSYGGYSNIPFGRYPGVTGILESRELNRPTSYGGYSNIPFGRYPGVTGAYSPYGSPGMLGYTSRYGYPNAYNTWADMGESETALIRMAEESSRPAFQSIESLVNAVGSISMMLESTYHAVHSSYRAVLGVVENFSRLKNHLASVLSSLALLRTIHWLLLRLLYYLRLRETNPSVEAAWSSAANLAKNQTPGDGPPHSSWPILVFVSMVFGAPWLIFRIFSKMAARKQLAEATDQTFAEAMYEFRASQPGELSLKPGQRLAISPKCQQPKMKGWILAQAGNNSVGLVPINYIRMYKKVKKVKPNAVVLPLIEEKEDQPSTDIVKESGNDFTDTQ